MELHNVCSSCQLRSNGPHPCLLSGHHHRLFPNNDLYLLALVSYKCCYDGRLFNYLQGHSMLLDYNMRTLYIFAGQREGTFLSDMHAFDLKTHTAIEIFSDSAALGGPDPSFGQRAVIDPDRKEIYV